MKRVLSVLCVAILSASVVLAAGCEESQQTSDKKARLVFIENSELKEQAKSLQQQLQQQKDLVAACQQEKVSLKAGASTIEPTLLKIFDEMAKKHQALTAENKRLKGQIAELKPAPKD
jgi:hypothetical protein